MCFATFFLPAFFVSKLSEASYTCRGTISHPENEHPRSAFKSVFLISLNLHVSVIVIIFELVMLSSGGFSVVVRFLIVSTRRRHRRVAARSIKEFRAVFLNVLWFFFHPSVKFLSLRITVLSRGCFRIRTARDNLYCCTQIIIITRLSLRKNDLLVGFVFLGVAC